MCETLQQCAFRALMESDPSRKVALVNNLYERLDDEQLSWQQQPAAEVPKPGRPAKPELVKPGQVAMRGIGSVEGRQALIHALTHIEFNAINLALDAVYRFSGLPVDFYRDWMLVAKEEALHFSLLREHLNNLGAEYGDFLAHNGLWEMALKTQSNVLERMALVPRVMEARGLDVTPGIMQKLQQAGDTRAVEILKIIQRDEVGHVKIGNRWFHHACIEADVDAVTTFTELLQQHMQGQIRGPFDEVARSQAGFSEEELEQLRRLDAAQLKGKGKKRTTQ